MGMEKTCAVYFPRNTLISINTSTLIGIIILKYSDLVLCKFSPIIIQTMHDFPHITDMNVSHRWQPFYNSWYIRHWDSLLRYVLTSVQNCVWIVLKFRNFILDPFSFLLWNSSRISRGGGGTKLDNNGREHGLSYMWECLDFCSKQYWVKNHSIYAYWYKELFQGIVGRTNRLHCFHYILSIWYESDIIENNSSNISFAVVRVVVAAGICLPSRFLATAVSYGSTIPAFGRHVTFN
jgi:hypothetical protein